MTPASLDERLYLTGLRRSLYPKMEADLLAVPRKDVIAALKRLIAARRVYANKTKPGYWGGVEDSYRSNK